MNEKELARQAVRTIQNICVAHPNCEGCPLRVDAVANIYFNGCGLAFDDPVAWGIEDDGADTVWVD